jgi:exonuclease SbcC
MKQVTEQTPLAERLGALEREVTEATARAAGMESVAEQHATLQAKVAGEREEMAAKRVTNTHLKEQMLEIKQRIDGLSERTVCPECRQPLTPAHKAKLEAEYAQQGQQRKELFRANERAWKELEATVAQGEAELQRLVTEVAGRQSAHQRLAMTQTQLTQAREADKRLGQLQAEWAEHEAVLKGRQYAPEARALVLEMDTQIAALAYDAPRHEQVRARAAEMAAAEVDKQNLDRAREAAAHLESRERDGQAYVARVTEDVTAAEQRIVVLRADHDRYLVERGKLVELETQLKATESLREAARVRHTQARAAVEHCEFLERRLAESLNRQDSLLREQGVYAELATAFGKRGVQAMIIESAIPEIEQEANRLLGRMTDGRMNVAFETQRDARSGGGTIETLDIKIADELGTRSYEMFSGGESFRVNFAIRIALSKLLARRAGTRLQLLVIDEGFGSQDAEGRDRIVECIRAIQDEFAKILVITHLDDLRERFPVRIDIRKTPFGSTISLN